MRLTAAGLFASLSTGCATPPADTAIKPAPVVKESVPGPATAPAPSMADLAVAAMRMQAEIDRQIQEYQERPRKRFLEPGALEYRFAQYEEEWRAKIERVGRENYPEEARGRLHGNARVTVEIRSDGMVQSVSIDRSSGHEVLDRAVLRIIELASPFPAFPPAVARDTDLLVITRTWFFQEGQKIDAR